MVFYIKSRDTARYHAGNFIVNSAQFVGQFVSQDTFFALSAEYHHFIAYLYIRYIRNINHTLVHTDIADHFGSLAVNENFRFAGQKAGIAVSIADRNGCNDSLAVGNIFMTVAYAVEDPKIIGSEYEVVYTDRTQVDFENNGEWSSVERRYEAVPAAIVPEQIRNYLAGSSYPNAYITKIDRDKYAWEVELSSGLEIKFDHQFRVVEIDD